MDSLYLAFFFGLRFGSGLTFSMSDTASLKLSGFRDMRVDLLPMGSILHFDGDKFFKRLAANTEFLAHSGNLASFSSSGPFVRHYHIIF
jgi:hypothetical protein